MRSLQSRLASGLFLSLIVVFSSLWLLVSINIQSLAEDYTASRLTHDAENLLNSIRFDKEARVILDLERVDAIYKQPFSGHYYVISTSTQSIPSRSLWDHSLKSEQLITGQQTRSLQAGPEQQSLLVLSSAYKKQNYSLTITVAEDLNPINKNISQFTYGFSAMAVSMLLVLLILQIYILRKSLRSLKEIQGEIKLLQQGQLDKLSTDFPVELHPLINEVNHLLEIMQQRLRRSRDALGDLAHEIKKPLTVIKQIIEKNDMPVMDKNIIIRQSEDIYQITDRILKRARLAGQGHSGSLFSFTDDLSALIQTLNLMYTDKGVELTTEIAKDISCSLDRQDMLELLGNLLDNAYKWAKHRIVMHVTMDEYLHICIEDDGPGVEPSKINELSKRGVRLDEKVQGHGLGLAIAVDMIKDYQGQIYFSQSSDLGGFKVMIRLPLHIRD